MAGTPNDQLFSKDADLTEAREGMFLEAAGSFDIRNSILEIHPAIWTREVPRTPFEKSDFYRVKSRRSRTSAVKVCGTCHYCARLRRRSTEMINAVIRDTTRTQAIITAHQLTCLDSTDMVYST
ncbi:MAG: hypothetical protein HW389_2450 [Bacteroidetes bacterium]|nr:hypothetical protein [Bacteroidota bacterium]